MTGAAACARHALQPDSRKRGWKGGKKAPGTRKQEPGTWEPGTSSMCVHSQWVAEITTQQPGEHEPWQWPDFNSGLWGSGSGICKGIQRSPGTCHLTGWLSLAGLGALNEIHFFAAWLCFIFDAARPCIFLYLTSCSAASFARFFPRFPLPRPVPRQAVL